MKRLKQKLRSWLRAWLFPESRFTQHVIQIPTETLVLRSQSTLTQQQISDISYGHRISEDEILRMTSRETVQNLLRDLVEKDLIEIRVREDWFGFDRRFVIDARLMISKLKSI